MLSAWPSRGLEVCPGLFQLQNWQPASLGLCVSYPSYPASHRALGVTLSTHSHLPTRVLHPVSSGEFLCPVEDQGRSIFVGDIIHLLSSQDHTEELVERPVHQHLLQWLYAQGAHFPGDREGTLNAWPGAGPGQVQAPLSGSKGRRMVLSGHRAQERPEGGWLGAGLEGGPMWCGPGSITQAGG